MIVTGDQTFTEPDDAPAEMYPDTHPGVIYIDRAKARLHPEQTARAVDKNLSQVPKETLDDNEFYAMAWMDT